MLDSVLLGLRVALSLALVLVILWVIARKVNAGTSASRRVPVTVLGRQSLGRRSGVAVVEVAGRTLLLGVSDDGVRLLTELDDAGRALEAGPGPLEAGLPGRTGTDAAAAAAAAAAGAAGLAPIIGPVRSFDDVLAAEVAPRHRARRRAAAQRTEVTELSTGPLAGSVLDKATWTRAWAVLQERSSR